MKKFSGDTFVMTEKGLQTISDIYKCASDISIIVHGEKHKVKGIEYCGCKHLVKVTLRNGMELCVEDDQHFVDDKGHVYSLSMVQANPENMYIYLDQSIYRWDGGIGVFEEGYILAMLVRHGAFYFDKSLQKHSLYVNVKVPCKYKDPNEYFPYYIVAKDAHRIDEHMVTSEWIKFRIYSQTIYTIAHRFNIIGTSRKLYEKGSYNFTIGMLRYLLDVDFNIVSERGRLFMDLDNDEVQFLQSVQRLLHSLGISSNIRGNMLSIESSVDLLNMLIEIDCNITDKREMLREYLVHHKKTYKNHSHLRSKLKTCCQDRFSKETYALDIDGDIITVNGILAKA